MEFKDKWNYLCCTENEYISLSGEKNHTSKSTNDLHGFCFLFMLIAIHKFVSKPSHRKGSVNKPNTTTEGIDTTISVNNSFYCSECTFRQLSVLLSENKCLKLSLSRFSFLKDKTTQRG